MPKNTADPLAVSGIPAALRKRRLAVESEGALDGEVDPSDAYRKELQIPDPKKQKRKKRKGEDDDPTES